MKAENIKKGFSIGEAVISVFVLAVGLVATVNLFTSSLSYLMNSRDHIVASQLAQEGVELIRNVRDNNWANDRDSFDYFPTSPGGNCIIDKDYLSGDIDCTSHLTGLYYYGDFYVHNNSAGEATKFQREIELSYNATDDEFTVTSIVIWGNNFPTLLGDCNIGNKCAYTQSILTKWGEY